MACHLLRTEPLSKPIMACWWLGQCTQISVQFESTSIMHHLILALIITLWPRQNDNHFPDDIFKCIFLNEALSISLKISLKFIPKVSINNIPALIQIMAWRRPGDKPLSEPMMVSLPAHICVTRPQWFIRVVRSTPNAHVGIQVRIQDDRYFDREINERVFPQQTRNYHNPPPLPHLSK